MGESVWKSGMCYGYGSQFLDTATEWLRANGYLSGAPECVGTQYLREHSGYAFTYESHTVKKRDL
jgi:hypothetical protein